MSRHINRGFTLIEIMIVIAIIAILAAIVVPNILEARQEAMYTACMKNCENIGQGLASYLVRHSNQELMSFLGLPYESFAGGTSFSRNDIGGGTIALNWISDRAREYLFGSEDYLKMPQCPANGKSQYYTICYNHFAPEMDGKIWPGWCVVCARRIGGAGNVSHAQPYHTLNGVPTLAAYCVGAGAFGRHK